MTQEVDGKSTGYGELDCASFCVGYVAGTGGVGGGPGRTPAFTVCRNLSIIVSHHGNDPHLSIEEYDRKLLTNMQKWDECGGEQFRLKVLEPFLDRVRKRDETLDDVVKSVMFGEMKNGFPNFWYRKKRSLKDYSDMLDYHHFHRQGGPVPYDVRWYEEYENLSQREIRELVKGMNEAKLDDPVTGTGGKDGDDDENDSTDASHVSQNGENGSSDGRVRKRLSLPDYLLATKGFADKVKEFLQGEVNNRNFTVADGQILIEAKDAAQKMILQVLGVEGEIFDDNFVEEMEDWIDSALFAREEELKIQSQKGRMYLIESLLDDAVFSLSKGKIIMKASQLSDSGRKLLDWVRRFCDVQNKMVEDFIRRERKGQGIEYKPYRPNLIQIVVGKGDATYGQHDDTNPETQVRSKNPLDLNEVKDGSLESKLPFDYEQQVLTVVLTVGIKEDNEDGHCNLHHYLKTDRDTAVLTTKTTDMGLHFQAHGVQRYCYHDVDPVKVPVDGSKVKRIILSFRETVEWKSNEKLLIDAFRTKRPSPMWDSDKLPINDPDEYGKYYGVLQDSWKEVTKENTRQKPASSGGEGSRKRRTKNGRVPFTRTFLRNYARHVSVQYMPRPGRKISIPSDARAHLRYFKAVRTLIEKNMHMSAKSADQTTTVKYLDRIYTLGQLYVASVIRNDHGIVHGAMQADLYNTKMVTPDVMVPEQWYKNSLNEIRRILQQIRKTAEERGEESKYGGAEWIYEQPPGAVEIWFGPKGGNPMATGQFGQPDPKDKNKAVIQRTETFQNMSSNQGLDENDKACAVFQLFVPVDWGGTCDDGDAAFVDDLKKKCEGTRGDQKVIYLGLWYFHHSICMEREDMCDPNFDLTKWLRAKQTLYYCRPLYDCENKPPPDLHNSSREQIELAVVGDDPIAVWISSQSPCQKTGTEHCQVTEGMEGNKLRDPPANDGGTELHDDLKKRNDYVDAAHKKVEERSKNDVLEEWIIEQAGKLSNLRNGTDASNFEEEDVALVGFLTAEEFLVQAARLGVATFARFLGYCFHGENNDEMGYLCKNRWLNLGWVCGANAIPHPIRSYNLQTHAYILACGTVDEAKKNFVLDNNKGKKFDGKAVAQLLFKSTVIRMAGTIGWYYLYAEEKGRQDKDGVIRQVIIPSMDDIDDYFQFLERRRGCGNTSSMNDMNKCLYHNCLLSCSKASVHTFRAFLDSIAAAYKSETVRKYNDGTLTRKEWIEHVKVVLARASNDEDDENATRFIASLIIADVEEVLENPFGPAGEVVYGHGGQRGINMVKSPNDPVEGSRRGRKKSDGYGEKYSRSTDAVFSYLTKSASSHLLACLGLYKDDGTGSVCVLLNGRTLKITDVDNMACKISMCQGRTTGARTRMKDPGLNFIYDFPLFPAWRDYVQGGDHFGEIANQAIGTFDDHGPVLFASVNMNFQHNNESEEWPRMCDHMERGAWMELGNKNVEAVRNNDGRRTTKGRKRKREAPIASARSEVAKKPSAFDGEMWEAYDRVEDTAERRSSNRVGRKKCATVMNNQTTESTSDHLDSDTSCISDDEGSIWEPTRKLSPRE